MPYTMKQLGLSEEPVVYVLTVRDVQEQSQNLIGRLLTEDEIDCAINGIESGLNECVWDVVREAVREASGGR